MSEDCNVTEWRSWADYCMTHGYHAPKGGSVCPLGNDDALDAAYDNYLSGEPLTTEQAGVVWALLGRLGLEDERLQKIVTLGRVIDRESARGDRCSVCAGVEGNHDDC